MYYKIHTLEQRVRACACVGVRWKVNHTPFLRPRPPIVVDVEGAFLFLCIFSTVSKARKMNTTKHPSHCTVVRCKFGFLNTENNVLKIFLVVVTVVRTKTSKEVIV